MNKLKYFVSCLVIVMLSSVLAGCLRPITPGDASSETVSVDPITTDVPETTDPITETSESVATEPIATEDFETVELEEHKYSPREGYGFYDQGYWDWDIYASPYSLALGNAIILSYIHGQEMTKEAIAIVNKKMEEGAENRQLILLYYIIQELGTKREDFIEKNEYFKKLNAENGTGADTYSDTEIEYLFGDYSIEERIEHLRAPWSFYYRGRLYSIYNIFQIENEKLLKEMYRRGNLQEYIDFMKVFLENGDIRNYIPEGYYYTDGYEERKLIGVIEDFENLPLKEFQQKHSLEYGIGVDWENYVPTEGGGM
ncbi:MAG: hypothetical protein IKS28_07980 [Clostridia bacterium]|nr:hypothetical protein [Clostridia bacterium]